MRLGRIGASVVLASGLIVGMVSPAQAAVIRVDTTADQYGQGPTRCSLREAVQAANTDAAFGGCPKGTGIDTIRLPAGTVKITRTAAAEDANVAGDLDVTERLTIVGKGSGAGGSTIDANGDVTAERGFHLHGDFPFRLTDLRVRDGRDNSNGGGIYSPTADVTLVDALMTGNRSLAGYGGAIATSSGDVRLLRSLLQGNRADGDGGAIRSSSGTIRVERSTLKNNHSLGDGGGVRGLSGVTQIVDSSITGNKAIGGGGIRGTTGSISVLRSTLSGNRATNGDGGGIDSSNSPITITRSTLSGNVTTGEGGAVRSSVGAITIDASTVSGNRADDNGGGIYAGSTATLTARRSTITRNITDMDDDGSGGGGGIYGSAATMSMTGSILAANQDLGTEAPDCLGPVSSTGYNLVGNNNGCTYSMGAGDKVGSMANPIAPKLKALGNFGGPTKTHAPKVPSPVLSAGNPSGCGTVDQRGVPRPGGNRCDIGAHERVECAGREVNRVGTNAAERMVGTSGNDGFLAFGGGDVLIGLGGSDGMCAGGGADVLRGGGGPDRMKGGTGQDFLNGGGGNDKLNGGGGPDACLGGSGTDSATLCEQVSAVP